MPDPLPLLSYRRCSSSAVTFENSRTPEAITTLSTASNCLLCHCASLFRIGPIFYRRCLYASASNAIKQFVICFAASSLSIATASMLLYLHCHVFTASASTVSAQLRHL
jgi:hypothetical protein